MPFAERAGDDAAQLDLVVGAVGRGEVAARNSLPGRRVTKDSAPPIVFLP